VYYGLVRGELDTLDGHWTHALTAQGVDAVRDSFSLGSLSSGDDGKRQRYSYESTLRFGSEQFAQTLVGALDREREEYQNRGAFVSPAGAEKHSTTNSGVVLQYDARIEDRIGLGAAVRHDDNDRFDNDNTYRVQASFRFAGDTRLRAAAGSGVKNPGVYACAQRPARGSRIRACMSCSGSIRTRSRVTPISNPRNRVAGKWASINRSRIDACSWV
jgi:vitamin B12 transporter